MSISYLVTLAEIGTKEALAEILKNISELDAVMSVRIIEMPIDLNGFLSPFEDGTPPSVQFWTGFAIGCESSHRLYINITVGNLSNDELTAFESTLGKICNIFSLFKAHTITQKGVVAKDSDEQEEYEDLTEPPRSMFFSLPPELKRIFASAFLVGVFFGGVIVYLMCISEGVQTFA